MADLGSATRVSMPLFNGAEAQTLDVGLVERIDHDPLYPELCHRIHNIVAIVQPLVNQTLRDGVTIAAAHDSLNQRLAATGGAVDLLLRSFHFVLQAA